jgi:hypothetical protein
MRGELNLLVSPLGGTVLTSDQAHPMDAPEIPIDECVSGLGVVARTISQPQMPCGASHECDSKNAFSSSAFG